MTLSTIPAAFLMKRIGRANGFTVFLIIGCAGAGLMIYALLVKSFLLFCVGSALFGASAGANQQFRFAAVDAASDEFEARPSVWSLPVACSRRSPGRPSRLGATT